MIKHSKYMPKQMNGPVLNAEKEALEDRLTDAETIADYLYHLSILTAQEKELESIGCIVGYPRPLVPIGFNEENILTLGTIPIATDMLAGLSTIDSEIGGHFSTTQKSKDDYMAIGLYRKFLDKVAYIKRYGVTLYSVDQIARLITDDYTISWRDDHDILVYFPENIGYKNVWILSQLFLKLSTEPQVIISSGGED